MLESTLRADVYVRKKEKKCYLKLSEFGDFFYCEEAYFKKIISLYFK